MCLGLNSKFFRAPATELPLCTKATVRMKNGKKRLR